MSEYLAKLHSAKKSYPFQRWLESGLEQYTPEACANFVAVFDSLIEDLATTGEMASETDKIECFHKAVMTLNTLNEEDESLIETGEREDLCELCNVVSVAAGLEPSKYGGGEGLASEWRDW